MREIVGAKRLGNERRRVRHGLIRLNLDIAREEGGEHRPRQKKKLLVRHDRKLARTQNDASSTSDHPEMAPYGLH